MPRLLLLAVVERRELPWHYVPVWLAMSLPPVVLAGLSLSPLAWRRDHRIRTKSRSMDRPS